MRRSEEVAYLRGLPPERQPWYGRGRGMGGWGWSTSCLIWEHPVASLAVYLGLGAVIGGLAARTMIGPESTTEWTIIVGGGIFVLFLGVMGANWFLSWLACRNALSERTRVQTGVAPSWWNGPTLPPPPPPPPGSA